MLIGRLALASVFLLAGLTKLVDRPGAREATRAFGVPPVLSKVVGTVLPLAELAVVVMLLPAASAYWGALGTLGLLLVFSVAIAASLVRGQRPECHCFGQLHSAPVGWRALTRNLGLAALAGFVVLVGGQERGLSAVAWLGHLTVGETAGLGVTSVVMVAGAVEGWFLVHLLRQHGRILLRLEALEAGRPHPARPTAPSNPSVLGLPIGSAAPEFALPRLHGETLTLGALRANGKPVLLLFTDAGCGPCTALLPEIGRWQSAHAPTLTIAVVGSGKTDELDAKARKHGIANVLVQQAHEVAEAYQYAGTPGAVAVSPDGLIASEIAAGADAIRQLVRDLTSRTNPPTPLELELRPPNDNGAPPRPQVSGLPLGTPAPRLTLPDLEGNSIKLADPRGRATVVLFWNPACGFCQAMLPDLRAWEAAAPEESPRLLVVSTGDRETNRALGLRSTILLDGTSEASKAFAAPGTPMGVLIDQEGRIASPLAIGAPAVLALAASPPSAPATSRWAMAGDPSPSQQLQAGHDESPLR
ncbi:MauE/DoxX family redox-associated membrane protein [Streptomyces sp. NPDC058464]|uniref:MauE/DoxX family redox-associated membrane protein n=1 Tax=Streptomyces sp. NPDC058464 TaxID=3346511 RepID=UPI0036569099